MGLQWQSHAIHRHCLPYYGSSHYCIVTEYLNLDILVLVHRLGLVDTAALSIYAEDTK